MLDEKELELLTYEVALLVRGGWRLYNGTWSHRDAPEPAYERSVALGVQLNWDRNRERFSCAKPTPIPSQEPATVPRPGMVPSAVSTSTMQPPVRPSPLAPPPTVQEGPRRRRSPLSKTRS